MKAIEVVKRGVEKVETAGLVAGVKLQSIGLGSRRSKRGLSTVETIALTVVVVGAVVAAAGVLNPKLSDLITRTFDMIATSLGV